MELDLGKEMELSGVVTQGGGFSFDCPQEGGVYERASRDDRGDLCRNGGARWDCPVGCTAHHRPPYYYMEGGKPVAADRCGMRGGTGGVGVTSFKIQYKTAAGSGFEEFDTIFRSVDTEYLKTEWASNPNKMVKAFFPKVVAARYIRFVVETFVGQAVMRADVLLHLSNNMFAGKHVFRRCLETDRFTRIVNVPPLTNEEAREFMLPKHFVKSIECSGC
jgi:hypothetical protein